MGSEPEAVQESVRDHHSGQIAAVAKPSLRILCGHCEESLTSLVLYGDPFMPSRFAGAPLAATTAF
jgi:hypothetical protein